MTRTTRAGLLAGMLLLATACGDDLEEMDLAEITSQGCEDLLAALDDGDDERLHELNTELWETAEHNGYELEEFSQAMVEDCPEYHEAMTSGP